MAGDCDRIALIHALADLAGRPVPDEEAAFVLAHARQLTAQRANEIWSQHRRAPATVSMRNYLAMTLLFLARAHRRESPAITLTEAPMEATCPDG